MIKTFPQAPYFDDYDIDNNYLKMLFRPGYALQTREMNSLQSMLQQQIEAVGSHLFQNGAMVIPGYISNNNKADYVKLASVNAQGVRTSTIIDSLLGQVLTGATSGAQALVVHVESTDGVDPDTIYVQYQKSGINTKFLSDEVLSTRSEITVSTAVSNAIGVGSLAMIGSGIYYIKGFFVQVAKQTITLEKYDVTPTYKVGLLVSENVVSSLDDETLNDNAIGTYNYYAPGANRYQIQTTLTKLDIDDSTGVEFIELLRLQDGVVESKVVITEYSIIEKTLARRTYDESGDYSVIPFKLNLRQHNDNDRGARKNSTHYSLNDIIEYNDGTNTYTYTCIKDGTSAASPPSYVTTFGTFTDGGCKWEYTERPDYNLGVYTPEDLVTPGDESKIVVAFEAGKAYVRGFEIEKFGTSYVSVNKPRDFQRHNTSAVTTTCGNYVRISTTALMNNFVAQSYPVPTGSDVEFPKVTLYSGYMTSTSATPTSGTAIGTANVSHIEDDGVAGFYKVFLFNTVLNSPTYTIEKDVRSLYYNNASGVDFIANIYPEFKTLRGSITIATNIMTGNGTLFTKDLSVGDYITYTNGTGSNTKLIYLKILTIETDTSLTLTTTPTAVSTPSTFFKCNTKIYEPNKFPMTAKFTRSYIRNVKSTDDTTSVTDYTITRTLRNLTVATKAITFTLTAPTETFAAVGNNTNYTVINHTTGKILTPLTTGTLVVTVTGASKTVTVTDSGTDFTNGDVCSLIVAIDKNNVTERTKTLTVFTKDVTTTLNAASAAKISLGKVDCFRLLSVKMAASTGAISGTLVDITDNFNFDTGIRSSFYGPGYISLKPGYFPPTGSIRIVFEYFTHGAGDYFSVDSYTSNVPYEKIEASLRDILDFRPSTNATGTAFSGDETGVLKRGNNISAEYSYYLNRIDVVSIDPTGKFFTTKGIPSLTPVVPKTTKIGMPLAILRMFPYGIDVTPNSINVELINNKRYTMRDIGALESRIGVLEYYTSLSLLEQETTALNIVDEFNLPRYKNGFIVDSFSDHGVGFVSSGDYRCSIDIENKELRPLHNVREVTLVEEDTNAAQRAADGYTITGDLITLPYTTTPLVKQLQASTVKNINPFAIFSFVGNTAFIPSSDIWFDDKYLPDNVVQKEGNYTSTQQTLASAGVLGDRWNEWQTIWTGRQLPELTEGGYVASFGSVTTQGFTSDFVVGKEWPNRKANLEVAYIDTVVSNRTGINTSVNAKFDTRQIDDRIVSTSTIPYMRQKRIRFVARGLKPNTVFYPFFDNKAIGAYVTPASTFKFTYVAGSAELDYTTNVGSSTNETARLVNGLPDNSMSTGDVIIGEETGATAVVIAVTYNSIYNESTKVNTAEYLVHLVNIIGTFTTERARGSISNALINITTRTLGVLGGTLTSTVNGLVCGIFDVPATNRMRFRTGEREFALTTSSTNGTTYESISRTPFFSAGVLQTKQKTIESVKNAEIVQTQLTQNRTVVSQGTTVINTWFDPLAQTFLVQKSGGAFLTSVDIFFAKKSETIPVRLEIREVENGYPGKTILPYSQVILNPDKVNLSTTSYSVGTEGIFQGDDTATTFTFSSPVYVKPDTEYCIVLLSDSNDYYVWISQLGQKQIGKTSIIDKQPYAGVFFESQNASTWTANQNQDLKFRINRAVFTTGVTGNVAFVNRALPSELLSLNSLQTTNGSKVVRVYHYNHGMSNGDSVTMSGITATVNAITTAELNKTHIIANVDVDSYTITVTTTNANKTGFAGGSTIKVTYNARYDSIHINTQALEFAEAFVNYDIKTTSTSNVLDSTPVDFEPNITFNSSRTNIVASQIIETTSMSGAKSMVFTARMQSSNNSISPVIEANRVSAICISNRISNPTNALNVAAIDFRTLCSASSLVDGQAVTNRFITSDATIMEAFATVVPGKYITVTGSVVGNNGTFLVTEVADDGSYIGVDFTVIADTGTLTITVGDYFVNEICPLNGSNQAKYVTKLITLENLSTSFKLIFGYNKPSGTFIDVYYRIGTSQTIVNEKPYTLLTNAGLVDTIDTRKFVDGSYQADNLISFTVIQVKLVFRSNSTASVPKVKDFRLICLA